jgi:hypothetical protein
MSCECDTRRNEPIAAAAQHICILVRSLIPAHANASSLGSQIRATREYLNQITSLGKDLNHQRVETVPVFVPNLPRARIPPEVTLWEPNLHVML